MSSTDYLETSWRYDDDSPIIKIKDVITLLDSLHVESSKIQLDDLKSIVVSQDYDGKQKERLSAANLDFPILVAKKGNQYIMIIDGNHRTVKAIRSGQTYILARVLNLDDVNVPEEFKKVFS